MIRTLVTGGTGLVGSAIVKHLVRARETVRVLTRDPVHVDPRRRSAGTEFAQGDIFDEASLLKAMEGSTALVIATQFENAPFERPSKGLTYERVDGEGTERQIGAAKKSGITRVIYISGAGVREGRDEPWFRAKAQAEKAVKESGMQWTIFRPSWIYGPTDRSLNKFRMFARLGPVVPVIGTGKERVQPVYVEDVGLAVRLALNSAQAYGKTFDIGGPQSLSMKEIIQTLLDVLGKKRVILPHPKPLMKAIASLTQCLPLGGLRLTPSGIDFLTMEETVDNTALLETLEIQLTPLKEGLQNYLLPPTTLSVDQLRRHAA
jgi:uncharacterized protein YbjT (DUF2867 family)